MTGIAGVVVSCKIPILATRVRFPGDAVTFFGQFPTVDMWMACDAMTISPMNMIGIAGVVVSCKIPILATRVRFPGDALTFLPVSYGGYVDG